MTKREVDNYLPGRRIPHIELEAHPIGDSVTRLVHKVELLGAKPPRNKFMLSYLPTQVLQEGIIILIKVITLMSLMFNLTLQFHHLVGKLRHLLSQQYPS